MKAGRAVDRRDLLPVTRFAYWADLIGVLLAGSQLAFAPERTADFASWTIAVPLTAAFLGFGYWTTLPSMVMALRSRDWARTRILPVMALVLTIMVVVVTLRDLGPFHLTDGPAAARFAAWAWVVLYLALPPINAAALILEQRASGRRDLEAERPLLPWVRALLLLYGAGLTAVGLGLVFASGAVEEIWPWPITRLTGGTIGAFVLTLATGCWWGLMEGDWGRFRLAAPFLLLYFPAGLLAALLFSDDLHGGARTVGYVAVLSVSLAVFAVAAWRQETATRVAAIGP